LSIAVNLGRVVIMRQVADWLGKHATLPIDTVIVRENGSVTIRPSSNNINGGYERWAEIHNLYAIAEAAGAEIHVNSRAYSYSYSWQLTVAWNIGQIPVESEVTLSQMAVDVRPAEPAGSEALEASAAAQTSELVAAHA